MIKDSRHFVTLYAGERGELDFRTSDGVAWHEDNTEESSAIHRDLVLQMRQTLDAEISQNNDLHAVSYRTLRNGQSIVGLAITLPCPDHSGRIGGVRFVHCIICDSVDAVSFIRAAIEICSVLACTKYSITVAEMAAGKRKVIPTLEKYSQIFLECFHRTALHPRTTASGDTLYFRHQSALSRSILLTTLILRMERDRCANVSRLRLGNLETEISPRDILKDLEPFQGGIEVVSSEIGEIVFQLNEEDRQFLKEALGRRATASTSNADLSEKKSIGRRSKLLVIFYSMISVALLAAAVFGAIWLARLLR